MMVRENDRFDQRELRVRRTAADRGDVLGVQRSARGEQRAGHAANSDRRAATDGKQQRATAIEARRTR